MGINKFVEYTEHTEHTESCDVLIIGAGPGGLAAAKGAKEAGADKVIIFERDDRAGGILNQCIHDGFGLIRYKEQLTGPEYAERATQEAVASGAELLLGHHVVKISSEYTVTFDKENTEKTDIDCKVLAISKDGLKTFRPRAIILSTGCRERTRGAISIPGSRPAGIFTAGVVQNLVNCKNIMPGKRVVILGSGDVGMIMARRLTLEGAEVKAVIEILPEPAGLSRNVSQCLYDFDIPIKCKHTVSKIIGKKKIEAVEVSALDDNMKPVKGTEEIITCDCLLLSVGLIPENEVAETAGVILNPRTNGAETNQYLQTNVPFIFSCGNSRSIMDLADFVSEQGELAGKNAVAYIHNQPHNQPKNGENIRRGQRQEMSPWNEARTSSMTKGFPKPNTVTCSLCPNGCQIKYSDNTFSGYRCPKGKAFAIQELTNPKRMLTTTVKFLNGCQKLLPVKTQVPVNKEEIINIVKMIHSSRITAPTDIGDTVCSINSIPIIATGSTEEK